MAESPQKMTREEQARVEVGYTTVSPALASFLVFFFLAVMLLVPLTEQACDAVQKGGAPNVANLSGFLPSTQDVSEAFSTRGVWGGLGFINAHVLREIKRYDDALKEESVLAERLIPPMQSLMIGHLDAGNENAYCGRDGWLFYRPGIDALTGPGFLTPKTLARRARLGDETHAPPQPDPVKAIVEFRDQLAARGIALVVLPAPDKAAIYPEKLSRHYDGRQIIKNPSYDEFVRRLDEAGVLLCDTAPAVMASKRPDAPAFLATDTHWTPQGMAAAAQELARFIREHVPLPAGGTARFVRENKSVENLGDIAVMLKLPENQTFYRPETAVLDVVHLPDGGKWKADPNADILFLGDSFANIFSLGGMGWGESAGLVEHVSALLERPVDTMLINDNGAHATRRQLSRELGGGKNRLAGKKLVIWEFAARELAVGDWKLGLDLAVPKVAPSPQPAAITGEIQATLGMISRPPKPGSVPYKDCIIAMQLTTIAPGDIKEAVAYAWGMRDNAWTPAAGLETGAALTLKLRPWTEAEKDFGSFNRVELDGERFLRLPTFWAELEGELAAPSAPAASGPAPSAPPAPVSTEDPFLKALAGQVAALEAVPSSVLQGSEGWLFFGPELRSMSVGPFWGEQARLASRAENPDYADPLPAITDFHEQLARANIELLIVPVPAKATIYPDMIPGLQDAQGIRMDTAQKAFFALLAHRGIQVLDLVPEFMARRAAAEGAVFCRQDSHWSGRGCELAAKLIAERIQGRPWLKERARTAFESEVRTVEIAGDLWQALGDPALPKEQLPLRFVGTREGSELKPAASSRNSPILLLGDSHNLIFSAGSDMLATGAGLPDQLARELGFPVDLVAVRGSGATPARMNLVRRGDNLSGKQLVIWCFSVREFTESPGGWRKLPVIK